MPNRLSDAFERAADILAENWQEVTNDGQSIPLKYWRPGYPAMPAIEWACVVGEERVEEIYDAEEQATIVRELIELDVRTPDVVARSVTAFQPDAVFEWNGKQWSFDEANSVWDTEFVTFALVRERLLHGNENRRANV